MPMSRGMLCTIYAKTADGVDAAQIREALTEFYEDEYFVKVRQSPTGQELVEGYSSKSSYISSIDIITLAYDAQPPGASSWHHAPDQACARLQLQSHRRF